MSAHPSPEVHPDDVAAAMKEMAEHRPTRWRSFANDNTILRCCGTDFGNGARKAKRDDWERTQAAWEGHVAAKVAAAVVASCEGRHKAEALEAWIGEWPATPSDGTFLATVARDGLTRAAAYRASERTDDE